MNSFLEPKKFRILVTDDEYAYLDLFKEVLALDGPMSFELVTCQLAVEAVQSVEKSIEQNQPFAVAFLDVRMPSGPDGLWAAKRIRDMDPYIEIAIITAYSDYDPQEIISYVPPAHKLLYMQKPFSLREIYHFAYALSSKWQNELNWLKINDNMEAMVGARTKELSSANEQLKRAEEGLHILSANLLSAQEKERKQIAMELHDDFGQILNVLKLNLRFIFTKLTDDQENLKKECEKSVCYVDEVLGKVRRLSHGLTPTTLDDLGLSTALNALIRDFARHTNIKISCDMENMDDLFPSMAQLIIYRVFQEALMNIHNHSMADHVFITAKNNRKYISFIIEDNGKGFDMKQLYSNTLHKYGLGLASMKERIRMLNGHLKINSRLSQGTKIGFKIPLHIKERSR